MVEALKTINYFTWDINATSKRLKIMSGGLTIESQTSNGPMKTSTGTLELKPDNIYYWEVRIDKGNYFKIGVTKNKLIDDLIAFSDNMNGWSFYSMGELRHNSNNSGGAYGIGYGVGDVIGIKFDQIVGNLSFYRNGKSLGTAFQSKEFTKFTFYPAIACLLKGEQISINFPERED